MWRLRGNSKEIGDSGMNGQGGKGARAQEDKTNGWFSCYLLL